MTVLAVVIIGLALVWYFVNHFERRRLERNYEHHEKRKESFSRLTAMLKKKDTDNNIDNHIQNKKL